MKCLMITNGSSTTCSNSDTSVEKYFEETFDQINKLKSDLGKLINVDLVVIEVFKPSSEKNLMNEFLDESLWEIYASEKCLDDLKPSLIAEKNLELVTGRRVGVARYSQGFKEEFLESLKKRV